MNICRDIRTYSRDNKGRPTGILIATKSTRPDLKYAIGWAKCNTKLDKFDKPLAVKIAIGRLTDHEDHGVSFAVDGMPHAIRALLPAFVDRCNRYFKE